EFDLAAEDRACAALVHHQQNEICGLTTQLEAEARSFERHHCWRAPRAVEVVAAAAGHGATAIASTDPNGGVDDGRHHDHACRFVEQVLRNIIGDIENFLHDHAGVLEPAFVFGFIVSTHGGRIEESRQADQYSNE